MSDAGFLEHQHKNVISHRSWNVCEKVGQKQIREGHLSSFSEPSLTINLKLKANTTSIRLIAFAYRYVFDFTFNDAAQTHAFVNYYHVYPSELDFLILWSRFISFYLLILTE